jgi:hypothetical protein
MTDDPNSRPHRRYTVTLRDVDGRIKTVRVLTNRGEAKAAYMAGGVSRGMFFGLDALDVEVRDDGPPALDASGYPIARGYGIDRNEW